MPPIRIDATCPECGSTNIIPVVYGSLEDELMQLLVQNLVVAGSCFYTGVGESLWGCADCDRSLNDPHLCVQEEETFAMRVYDRAVKYLFAEFTALPHDEYVRLTGRNWIDTKIKIHWRPDVERLVITRGFGEGNPYNVAVHTASGVQIKPTESIGLDWFDDMLAFVEFDEMSEKTIRTRLNRHYHDFAVFRSTAPDGEIQIVVEQKNQSNERSP